ncbi:MmcQ/YjbR family DNA-binding protein [Actinacidiphila glaucinigra]|uniref:MmcQ/YjbR family DNA-binding protein n=1 Tax=Actinacidiphila glaucinigra TaxID=235986 RepID=UPI0029AB89E4|nr:MmcQ/YjbR family DNA-binding protein [Streptomyces sp. PA03-3a]
MTTDHDPLAVRAKVRAFALTLPGSAEEFPWGESVVKVNKKVFVFLGAGDGSHPPGINVKLMDPQLHEHALSVPGAQPSGYGLGRAGWVCVPLTGDAPSVEVLCDWVEESYRVVAPKRLVTELDAR